MTATLPRKRKLRAVPKAWRKLLLGIPGYDPFAQAGDCWFDPDAATRVLNFARQLKYTEGEKAGKNFEPSPFQEAIIANLFGWFMKDDDGNVVRRYRFLLLYIPRGNGKTVFAAVLCLIILFLDNEAGMQVYGAANTRDQATLLYRHVKGLLAQSQALMGRVKIYDASKTINLLSDPLAFYRAIPAEEAPAFGYKAHAALVDELHVQPNRNLVDALTSSMVTRLQPLMIYMTTADYLRESLCNEVYDYASKVRDNSKDPAIGVNDPRFLPVIFEAAFTDDWKDEKVWFKANPNLGVSVKMGTLRDEFNKAINIPAYENTFRRMYLNQRTEQESRAISMEQWSACGRQADPIEWRAAMLEKMKGQWCTAGLDLASTNDLNALVVFFLDQTPRVVLPFFWATADAVQRRRRNRVPYDVWVEQGFMIQTDGNSPDYDRIRADTVRLAGDYPLKPADHMGEAYFGRLLLGVDRLFQGAQMCNQLESEGLPPIEFGQGFISMALPVKRLLEMIAAREIDHGNNPVLAWMAGNASTKDDEAGNLKFDKKKSGDKIDGIVALTMAVGMAEKVEAGEPTIYVS